MKKSILNFGKALNKAEQKSINGGGKQCCAMGSKIGLNYDPVRKAFFSEELWYCTDWQSTCPFAPDTNF
jgi:hypothetical protein